MSKKIKLLYEQLAKSSSQLDIEINKNMELQPQKLYYIISMDIGKARQIQDKGRQNGRGESKAVK